jgi:hypothetical protein
MAANDCAESQEMSLSLVKHNEGNMRLLDQEPECVYR